MRDVSKRGLTIGGMSVVVAAALFAHAAAAQSGTGTITGRVLWGPCIRAIPLPAAPDAQAQGQPQPAPAQPAPTTAGLPAGAVLVAVQSTGISARTNESGNFTLSSVPAGQFLTVAAGPVANAASAVAERPNVFLNSGDSMDIGTLSLGGSPTVGIACRVVPPLTGAPVPVPGETGSATAVPGDTGSATPAPDTQDANP